MIAVDPFIITRRQLHGLFASRQLVRAMIAAGWLTVIRPGGPGRETLFSYESAQTAFDRLKIGEMPTINSTNTTNLSI